MSHSLLKLIEYSLVPVAILILSKVLGIYFLAISFDIPIALQTAGQSILSFSPIVSNSYLLFLSSYSDLIMYIAVGIGFTIVTVNAVYFHDSHIDVKSLSTLARFNILTFVKGSFELYHRGIMWFVFAWIATLVIFINVLLQHTYVSVFVIALVYSLILTTALIRDLVLELDLTRKKLLAGNY